jgi:hypothetical protein
MTFALSLVVWTVMKFIPFSVAFDSLLLDTDLYLSVSPQLNRLDWEGSHFLLSLAELSD